MKTTKLNYIAVTLFFSIAVVNFSRAQEGKINIDKDPRLDKLLEAKKQLNKEEISNSTLRIQIFTGAGSELNQARQAQSKFQNLFNNVPTEMVYEAPNYKIRVGNFRNRLEADRFLVEVKKEFPSAFIVNTKKR